MPGMDGYEVCRRDPRGRRPRLPAGRDDHRQRRPGEAHGARGGGRRLRDQAVRPRELLARVALAAADQALPRHDRGAGGRAGGVEPRARGAGARAGGRSSSGWAGCAVSCRRSWPSSSSYSGDESFLESHRREIVVVFCDLRGFTPFAEAGEPEEVMGVLGEYHARAGRPDLPVRGDARAVRRRRADGVLQRPAAAATTRRRARSGWRRDARPGCRSSRRLEPAGPRPGTRHRHRAGLRDARPDRLRGPVRLRGDRQRHQPRLAAVRRGGAVADPGHRARLRGGRGRSWSASRSASWRSAASAGRCGPSTSRASTRPGRGMTGVADDRSRA